MTAGRHPLLDVLASVLDDRGLVADPDVLESYRHDHAALVASERPLAAALPTSTSCCRCTGWTGSWRLTRTT